MKVRTMAFAGLALFAQMATAPAQAAGAATIAGTIQTLSPLFTTFDFPFLGNSGNISARSIVLSLPSGISGILSKFPIISGNIPVLGNLTVAQNLQLAETVVAFQNDLPGLGAFNGALAPLITKITSVKFVAPAAH